MLRRYKAGKDTSGREIRGARRAGDVRWRQDLDKSDVRSGRNWRWEWGLDAGDAEDGITSLERSGRAARASEAGLTFADIWFGFTRMVLGIWLWAYGCGRMTLGIQFGCMILWAQRATALQTRAGQAQKYIPILNRKINNMEHYYIFRCMRNFCHHLGILLNSHNGFPVLST